MRYIFFYKYVIIYTYNINNLYILNLNTFQIIIHLKCNKNILKNTKLINIF
jgi:hypothetical protein